MIQTARYGLIKPAIALAGLMLLCGCSHTYVIKLNNGMRIAADGKPKYANENYYYTDLNGQKRFIPAGRVREIAPASMADEEDPQFKPKTSK